jgi:short-subunit dehydrogenase
MNVLITGASKGIGKEIAKKFASEGFDLVLCARNQKDLDLLVTELKDKNPKINIISQTCDVSKKEEVTKFSSWIKKSCKSLDILVNNAGMYTPGQVHKEKDGLLEQMIETNLYSAYHITRGLLDLMISKKSGHIFNVCSIASIKAYLDGGSYCISKFAMLGFSKVLREEMKEYNIRVTSVLPGATLTSSWDGAEVNPDRLMKPEDVASIIYDSYKINERTNVEEIILRPILGDI